LPTFWAIAIGTGVIRGMAAASVLLRA